MNESEDGAVCAALILVMGGLFFDDGFKGNGFVVVLDERKRSDKGGELLLVVGALS